MDEASSPFAAVRKRTELQGIVQGVGFRPFVYRTARRCGIRGRVVNSSDGVVIEGEGSHASVNRFLSMLKTELPPLARADRFTISDLRPHGDLTFAIEPSVSVEGRFAVVPPDVATCTECTSDFTALENRRFASVGASVT
jgi:hydrogenase maturation protein HypF